MTEIITMPDQVTPEWLTEKLRQKGYLAGGKVVSVRETKAKNRFVTSSHYLRVAYDLAGETGLPEELFMKIYKPGLNQELIGHKEVQFYNLFPAIMPEISVVPCFAANEDPETGRAFVLMADVSQTHYSLVVEDRLCNRAQLELLLQALARFHAYWWDHPRLGQGIGEFVSRKSFHDYITDLETRFQAFMDYPDNNVTPDRELIFRKIFANWEMLYNRLQEKRHLTLVHGDANPLGNVLYPNEQLQRQAYLIDWNYWQIDLAARDVAYAIILTFYPNQRTKFEMEVLKHYHDWLEEYGVNGYRFANFWNDYRLAVISNLLVPVIWCSWGISPEFWWPRYVKAFGAFDDLQCRELLD